MCEYCQKDGENKRIPHINLGTCSDEFLKVSGKSLIFNNSDNTLYYSIAPINYCPMCGRYLEEE